MKKVACLIACFSIAVLAQNEQYQQQEQSLPQYQQDTQQQQYDIDTEQQRKKVQKLVKKVTQSWAALEIQKESFYLSPADKESLYEKNIKKVAAGWAGLNFFPGFGLGSYIQGDAASGVKQSVMDGIGFTILWYGFIFTLPMVGDGGDDDDYKCDYECHYSQAKSVFISGYVVLIASRICGLIFPFVHQRKYNKALKSALNSNDISYSIDPLIVPRDGAPAVGLAFNFHY
jgi:hypothetical protein